MTTQKPRPVTSFSPLLIFLSLSSLISLVSSIYDVPSYYGHFSLRFFDPTYINQGTFTYFEYHYQVDFTYDNSTIYKADKNLHCISKYNMLTGIKTHVAGKCGNSGNVFGDIRKTMFNRPSSIVYYQPNSEAKNSVQNAKTYIVKDQTCVIGSSGCVLSQPYPTLSITNIRISP